ncbi:MAG: insulinase family protein [Thermoguttaceae bacterium]|nr:insulinase family protein [Thermoguttaceae bacterium]
MKDRDVYALDVLSAVLDGYDNARLPAKFVRENKTAIQVDADYEAIGRGPGLFVISGVPAKGISCEELEKSFKESVRDIAENGVTEKELNRVKRQLIASRTFKRDSIFSQAYEIGAFETAGPGYEQIETVIGQLKSVTPEEVKSVAKRYFTDDTLTVAKLIPLAASVPAEQNTAAAREGGAK